MLSERSEHGGKSFQNYRYSQNVESAVLNFRDYALRNDVRTIHTMARAYVCRINLFAEF